LANGHTISQGSADRGTEPGRSCRIGIPPSSGEPPAGHLGECRPIARGGRHRCCGSSQPDPCRSASLMIRSPARGQGRDRSARRRIVGERPAHLRIGPCRRAKANHEISWRTVRSGRRRPDPRMGILLTPPPPPVLIIVGERRASGLRTGLYLDDAMKFQPRVDQMNIVDERRASVRGAESATPAPGSPVSRYYRR
jgi:hypothetical protein